MGRKEVAAIASIWVIPISLLVNRIVPDPYMDEIFHIPQAQQYCNGNFRSWDPMITTPPGLYYLSFPYITSLFPGMFLLQSAPSFAAACSSAILRSTNSVLAVLCSVIAYEIIRHLRPALDDRKATIYAVVLALYPLHWFFTFLYYTDVASLTAVLAMYLACLKKKYLLSALLGALAVFMRQTNIVWVLFVACSGIIEITLAQRRDREVNDLNSSTRNIDQVSHNSNVNHSKTLRKRKSGRAVEANIDSIFSESDLKLTLPSGLLLEIQEIILTSWHKKWELLVFFCPFLVVFLAFVGFIFWNGSIVLGAKEAHTVSPHFAQIMYFSLVSTLFTSPLLFSSQAMDLLRALWKNKLLSFFLSFLALTAAFLSVHYFSIAHPYLLADNRHYTFYLWRKIINAHWSMKYLLVPIYVYSWFSIIQRLGKTRRKIWVLMYVLATAAVLVPAPLIEFRYYTIPFYLLMLHSQVDSYLHLLFLGAFYTIVNVFTMTMFLFRPFHWSHEPGVQRFIW